MKTAISIPDKLFAAAEREAKRRGVSRSKFYQEALEDKLKQKHSAEITKRLNANIKKHGDPSDGEDRCLEQSRKTILANTEWKE